MPDCLESGGKHKFQFEIRVRRKISDDDSTSSAGEDGGYIMDYIDRDEAIKEIDLLYQDKFQGIPFDEIIPSDLTQSQIEAFKHWRFRYSWKNDNMLYDWQHP